MDFTGEHNKAGPRIGSGYIFDAVLLRHEVVMSRRFSLFLWHPPSHPKFWYSLLY